MHAVNILTLPLPLFFSSIALRGRSSIALSGILEKKNPVVTGDRSFYHISPSGDKKSHNKYLVRRTTL